MRGHFGYRTAPAMEFPHGDLATVEGDRGSFVFDFFCQF